MDKEYRDMTADERLRVIRAAMAKDGFIELKKIIGEYETELKVEESPSYSIGNQKLGLIRNVVNKEGLAGISERFNYPKSNVESKNLSDEINSEEGKIYAPEHRRVAMEENQIIAQSETQEQPEETSMVEEQHKERVLKPSTRSNFPNARLVTPGEINNEQQKML